MTANGTSMTTLSTTTTTTVSTSLTMNTSAATSSSSVSTASSILSSLLTSLSTNITSTTTTTTTERLTNTTSIYDKCLQQYPTSTCRLAEFIYVLAYLLISVSLLPQIIHLFHHGSRYISGISYMWVCVRVLGLAALVAAHAFNWLSFFELIALVSTVIIFIQILISADNLHRQQKMILIGSTLLTWFIGGFIILLTRKNPGFLMKTGYLLLAAHMLPQILLNSLLRTAKAISRFSIMFLAMSNALLFASFYTFHEDSIYLVSSYYAFSFFLFVYLQILLYTDNHIHLISRSAHTVLTPGVDVFTGLDGNGTRGTGQDPQMFSIDDLETPEGTDVVYQPMTSNKPSPSPMDQTPMKGFVRYATLAAIFAIETGLTIMLIHRAWSPLIIFVPLSIPVILGLFFVLRTQLNILQSEALRKLL